MYISHEYIYCNTLFLRACMYIHFYAYIELVVERLKFEFHDYIILYYIS